MRWPAWSAFCIWATWAKASVLKELGKIAPVTAVRGNVDREGP
jgi:hypothetical protein